MWCSKFCWTTVSKNPVTIETLNSVVYERCKRDLGIDDMGASVRGLAALAPRSLYIDDKQVALNATVDSLRNELHLALDPLWDEVVGSTVSCSTSTNSDLPQAVVLGPAWFACCLGVMLSHSDNSSSSVPSAFP